MVIVNSSGFTLQHQHLENTHAHRILPVTLRGTLLLFKGFKNENKGIVFKACGLAQPDKTRA